MGLVSRFLSAPLLARPGRSMQFPGNVVPAENGKLPPDKVEAVMFHGCGMGKLHPTAAKAWFWLQTLCLNEVGFQLTVSSIPDAYRSYAVQEWAFRDRMRTPWNALCTWTTRYWQGKNWYLLRGKAQVATPGKSNHGWGLALDVFVWEQLPDGRWVKSSITKYPLLHDWLVVNAPQFGFYWNVKSESWHLEYCVGDETPQRILDIENWLAGIAQEA